MRFLTAKFYKSDRLLDPANFTAADTGSHSLTAEVVKDGKWYNRTILFEVTDEITTPGITGDGTAANPYLISTAAALREIAEKVNSNITYALAHYRMTANIDLNGEEWTPIGSDTYRFSGVFDGGGFTVSGLHLTGVQTDQGLFGITAIGGTVRRLAVNGTISGGENNGGIVGHNFGTIENCHSSVEINGGSYAGGIVGWNRTNGKIFNCYSTGSISGINYAGGITGYNSGTVKNCVSLVSSVDSDFSAGRINGNSPGSSTSNKALVNILINGYEISSGGSAIHGNNITIGTPLSSIFNDWNEDIWLIPAGNLETNCDQPSLKK